MKPWPSSASSSARTTRQFCSSSAVNGNCAASWYMASSAVGELAEMVDIAIARRPAPASQGGRPDPQPVQRLPVIATRCDADRTGGGRGVVALRQERGQNASGDGGGIRQQSGLVMAENRGKVGRQRHGPRHRPAGRYQAAIQRENVAPRPRAADGLVEVEAVRKGIVD